jgi:ubiquinone/menaquinone biosynthesis C-methylase UbiE
MCGFLDAKGCGVDPSRLAVAEGNQLFANQRIQLYAGTASDLPFENQSFDFVFFAFCLCLVDRRDLLAAVAQADRVLKNGGFLAITDFDPIHQHKRAYHHKEGIFSFKQDYAQMFTSSGMYSQVAKTSFSHHQSHFDPDGNERVSTTLLYKETDPY